MGAFTPIPPGGIIGVLGAGQLGRMLALAARRLSYRTHFYSPEEGTPGGEAGDLEVTAAYEDLDRLR
jgi:5-(carboxyamino)imidazole ribonucleotide synthase